MINNEQHNPPVSAAPTDSFQGRVQPWMIACFGAEISGDGAERNHRFLEESLELVQACGCTASEAHQLVDYVYGRPVGERAQEVGGVMVTLAALCLAQGLDMHAAGETELARIWTKVEAIRAKQAAKPKHSPLPQILQPDNGRDAALQALAERLVKWLYCMSYNDSYFGEPAGEVKRIAADMNRLLPTIAQSSSLSAQAAVKDVCAEMRALCSACGGTGDVHRADGEWLGECTCIHALAQRQAMQAEGKHPAPCARSCEAPAFQNQLRERDARIEELEAQLVCRRAPLSPETQQAITVARADGQTVASTSGGLVFMSDGAEPGNGELDCPACGGSGHAGDAAAGSAP